MMPALSITGNIQDGLNGFSLENKKERNGHLPGRNSFLNYYILKIRQENHGLHLHHLLTRVIIIIISNLRMVLQRDRSGHSVHKSEKYDSQWITFKSI